LALPAFVNGYPLVFIDTVSYLEQTVLWQVSWDKTYAYGPFLLLGHWRFSLWGALALQCAAIAWLLWLLARALWGGARPWRFLGLVGGMVLLTSLPWFAATLMPDVLSGVAVLSVFLLGFAPGLSRAEAAGLVALGAVAIASHLSHLVVAAAVLGIVVLVGRRLRPALFAALPLLLAVGALLAVNLVVHGRAVLSANGATFLLARLQDDGPATWLLRERCPAAGWHLCAHLHRLPMDSDEFLWDPQSPLHREADGTPIFMGSVRIAPEAREIVAATLAAYPLDVAAAMLRNGLRQLLMARIGDTLGNAHLDLSARRMIAQGFPQELAAFDSALQMQGRLEALAAPFAPLHALVLLLAAPAALFAWRRAAREGDRLRLGLVLAALVGITANALVTGGLSKPHHRYEARIVWLLPLAAALALPPRPRSEEVPHAG
ncbi:MAG: hypothetical protein RMK90_12815, partial [Acetobacteraceae bacterium]|nr:hypothetical protein [Acetobacteraceae bacterium]